MAFGKQGTLPIAVEVTGVAPSGLTHQKLADLLGVASNTVRGWASKTRHTPDKYPRHRYIGGAWFPDSPMEEM